MLSLILRRAAQLGPSAFPHFVSKALAVSNFDHTTRLAYYSTGLRLSPLPPSEVKPRLDSYDIELVDDDSWRVSSGLALADQGQKGAAELDEGCLSDNMIDEAGDGCFVPAMDDPDFDDIDNLRVRGRLFFKIDRESKEYEEYSFDFHRRNKSSKKKVDPKESRIKKVDPKESKMKKVDQKDSKMTKVDPKESKIKKVDPKESEQKVSGLKGSKRDNQIPKVSARSEKQGRVVENSEVVACVEKKKLRSPTYNQLTGPFHEPFCLDVYISKASVRACIVHRFTSKVVAVAHSISKDMKYDLGSTRNAAACAAVGEVLAQRALGDDIHDVIYTPRKGEKLEGKLEVVVQSLIDNGVNVKVKIKQRARKKLTSFPTA